MFPNMNFMSDKWDAVVWTPAWLKSLSKTSTSASDNTLLSRWKMTCFTLEARVFKGASKAILRWFKFISIEKESTSWLCFLFETTVFQYPCTEFVARPLLSAIPSFLPLQIMVLFLSTFTSSLRFVLTLPMHDHAHDSRPCYSRRFSSYFFSFLISTSFWRQQKSGSHNPVKLFPRSNFQVCTGQKEVCCTFVWGMRNEEGPKWSTIVSFCLDGFIK